MLKKNGALKTIRTNWAGNRTVGGKYVNIRRKGSSFRPMTHWIEAYFNRKKFDDRGKDWQAMICPFGSSLDVGKDSFVWLGHNSFIFNLGGLRMVLDPVLWDVPFVPRHSKLPLSPDNFTDISVLLLSHDHFDHTDKRSVKKIASQNPHIQVVGGLGIQELVHKWVPHLKVHEMGWYQVVEIQGITIYFLPSAHWSKRGVSDGSKRLWGAFVIEWNNKRIYYSGDTSFSSHFEEVRNLFGSIDYAFIGIGAYSPRWFMERNHISPLEAVEAAEIMNAGVTIPMHYSTFKLSEEPLFNPPIVFKAEALRKGVGFLVPHIGEIMDFY